MCKNIIQWEDNWDWVLAPIILTEKKQHSIMYGMILIVYILNIYTKSSVEYICGTK